MVRPSNSARNVVLLALAGNVLVAITKIVAAAVTGSAAMVSEAVHSVVDTANEGLLLLGYHQSTRRPDIIHPLGYGRELYFWSFIVALMVFALGAGVSIYQGIQHIVSPEPIEHVLVNYVVLALSFCCEAPSWLASKRKLDASRGEMGYWEAIHRSKDPPTFVVLFEDSAALIGIFIAAAGIYLSERLAMPVLDGVASLLIGLVLAGVAIVLARESKSLLIGERAAPHVMNDAVHLARSQRGVTNAEGTITVQLAPDQIVVALSVEFDEELTARGIEDTVEHIEDRIQAACPEIVTLFIKPQTHERFAAWKLKHFGN
ncbi:cation diffusion facilitator family transporter [Novosphingobium sp. AP12]|uniref:cation diffusion facilitator family transporter n=1 Tax=Novosphingobium sp. AP12 TaxID=1144305 RepID=UPI000271D96C|nr:cation diffusion facilitator family transporter [Novosphingobium sp. AP12]EJL20401.1 putative Co/Zn/Cd cation transporter [Novosphingobium sp. AP12]